ncbi:hypothetical protein KUTeg_008057 [Tegillarca granosa]|uniref:BTB domain-containing protein n=1 Tax=Tegillarca granosa TaxID=220873 RepID=A0ABQ9FB75_TEGGR|nr:hypothetical protein KUTeg_008057 [Tegillarca granosa]
MDKEEKLTINKQQQKLLQGIYQLYKENQLYDVILVVEGKEYPCYKNVLAASSQYFSCHSLDVILEFMFTGEIEIDNDNVQSIFMSSSLFEMLSLVDLCIDHMIKRICIFNCYDVYYFASYHYGEKLKNAAKNFFLENFVELCQTDEFLERTDVDLLESLIESDELFVNEEETVFETIITWILHDPEERKRHFTRLFKNVRLPLMNGDYVNDHVVTNPMLRNNVICRSTISQYKLYMIGSRMEGSDSDMDFGINGKPRYGMYNRKMIIFSGGANASSERSFTAYDPITKRNYFGVKQHPSFDFKYKIDYFSVVVTEDNSIYFLGGIFYDNHHFEDAGSALDQVFMYDQKKATWLKRKSMMSPRCAHASCSSENNIYVLGGKSKYPNGEALNKMEYYETDLDIWVSLEPMPLRAYHHSAVVYDGAIFVFGGIDEMAEYLDTVCRYDIQKETWYLVKTKMRKPRACFQALLHDDDIFIVGGSSKHENVLTLEIYSPEDNRWRFGSDFPDERASSSATVFGDGIYVCGGMRQFSRRGRVTRHVETKDLYKYSFKEDSWTKEDRLIPFANTQFCNVALVNTKYLTTVDYSSENDQPQKR